MTMKKILLTAVLLLPVIGLSAIVAQKEIDIMTAKTWRIKIKGYDPRHPLYGRFIQFQYDWPTPPTTTTCEFGKEECALCLSGSETAPTLSLERTTEASEKCTSAIELNKNITNIVGRFGQNNKMPPERLLTFLPSIVKLPNRYYIPEEYAPRLDKTFRQRAIEPALTFSVDLKITKGGSTYLTEMYIDNQPWRDWLQANPAMPKPPATPIL